MSTIWIQKVRNGLDARRLAETTAGGALIRAVDGHITRGGEFEKRAAFVPTSDLPTGTVSLAAAPSSLYVFGSAATPAGMPSGVAYQRLQNGADTLERVVSWDLFSGLIYAVGEFSSGIITHYYDGSTFNRAGVDARTIVVKQSLGGSPGDTVNILVDGVSVTGGPVAWAGSNSATTAAIIAAINAHVSSPDYTADPLTSLSFFLRAAVPTSDANGRIVTFVVTPGFGPYAAAPLDHGATPYVSTTRYVRTIGTKEYTLSGSNLQFSSVGDPTDWDGEAGGTGFGFIDTSSYTAGSEDLTAVVEFRNTGAVFSQRTVQTWSLAADPASNAIRQVLRNTGTSCPKSITQFGDGDIFYLDEPGLRSLRARGSSTAASTYGIGVRVDSLIVAKLRGLTEAERALVVGLIEPNTGNFWLIIKDTIYVYAYFEEEGVSAWTTYTTHYFDGNGDRVDFTVDDAVVFDRRVYLRSGDTIYVYGGLATGQETDATVGEMWTAYLDGDNPDEVKTWQSFDAAVRGEWAVAVGMSLADAAVEDDVAIIDRTTYNDERIGVVGQSTHASLRFRSRGTGAAVVGACALHYDSDDGTGAAASGWAPDAAEAGAWTAYPDGGDLATARVWHRRG